MESDKMYKIVFYLGCGWNFVMTASLLLTMESLPVMIGIETPRYPIFILFNITSIFFFGIMQWIIARNLYGHRSFVKMLMCAKLMMGVVFVYSILVYAPPKELIGFLAPGIVVDVLFGLAFWRFLVFSRVHTPA